MMSRAVYLVWSLLVSETVRRSGERTRSFYVEEYVETSPISTMLSSMLCERREMRIGMENAPKRGCSTSPKLHVYAFIDSCVFEY